MTIESTDLLKKIEEQGFFFSKEILFNFHNSLITKPFVILSGISGSGKSKIGELYAEILTNNTSSALEIIPVKPNWTDSKGLFGYHNILNNSYYLTPLVKLFIRALNNLQTPHFLILDEMNLAKTEYYFADYLSTLESRRLISKVNQINTEDFQQLNNNFQFEKYTKLSHAIILAAMDLNIDDFLKIEIYRNNNFSKLWHNQFCTTDNWTPQFRTELNQGPNRLANRFFECGGSGLYKLRKIEELSPEDQEVYKELKSLYEKYTKKTSLSLVQKNITLHNNNHCISSDCKHNCTESTCTLSPDKKYTCTKLYDKQNDIYLVPPSIPIPTNLFTIGTVNIDETTNMFSPKILDRCNVLEFNTIDFLQYLNLKPGDYTYLNSNILLGTNDFYFKNNQVLECNLKSLPAQQHSIKLKDTYPEYFNDILEINSILEPILFNFGYRVLNEISYYILNAATFSDYSEKIKIATDLQILQKILPKIHGNFETLWEPLIKVLKISYKNSPSEYSLTIDTFSDSKNNILNDLDNSKYPRTTKKLITMLDSLLNKGFTSYFG